MITPANPLGQIEKLYNDLLSQKIINQDGIINQDKLDCTSLDVTLIPTEEEEIKSLFMTPHEVIGRSTLSLCTITAEKVVKVTNQAAHSLIGHPVQVYLRGSTMRRLLIQTVSRIFHKLTGRKVHLLVKELFHKISLDTDYLIYSKDCYGAFRWHQILSYGLVAHLTKELKNQHYRPADLAIQLEQAYNKALTLPPGSYAYEVARQLQGKIHAKDPDLEKNCVEMCAFTRAVNKSNAPKTHHHFERVLGHGKDSPADDFTFSNEQPSPARPLDGLYVNLSANTPLQLQSFAGRLGLIQAIFDAVLNNITFDSSKPATPTDFVRTISFFTTGGRCFQQGWTDKIFTALVQEASKQNLPWPQFLAKQLISHTYHHYGRQQAILVCLTFNASALLVWKKYAARDDMRELWNLVFAELEKKGSRLEGSAPEKNSTTLIEGIKMALRGGDCEFADVYAQLQICTTLNLHRSASVQGTYLCQQMLTEHHIFTRIENCVEGQNYFLILPYDLPMSLGYASYLYINAPQLTLLKHLHSLIFDHETVFALEETPNKTFCRDYRLQKEAVGKKIESMLQVKQEESWCIAYLSALAQLAQHNDEHLFKVLLQSFITQLREKWSSKAFKETLAATFNTFLKQSRIQVDAAFFNRIIKGSAQGQRLQDNLLLDLTVECLRVGHSAFIAAAADFLTEISLNDNGLEAFKQYKLLLNRCLSGKAVPAKSAAWLIRHIQHHLHLGPNSKFLLLLHVFQHSTALEEPEIEHTLSKAFIDTLSLLTEIPNLTTQFKNHLHGIVNSIYKKRSSAEDTHQMHRFFNILAKLQLLDDTLQEAQSKLAQNTAITSSELPQELPAQPMQTPSEEALILEQMQTLLSLAHQTTCDNSTYETLVKNLIEKLTSTALPPHAVSQATEPLLKELHARKLWNTILLFANAPNVKQLSCLKYIFEACLEVFKADPNSLDLLFTTLSGFTDHEIINQKLPPEYHPLYKSLAKLSLEKKDYFELFKWLKLAGPLQQDAELWNFTFSAAIHAIRNGFARLAVHYLGTVPVAQEYAENWVGVFDALLKAKENKAALMLIEANKNIVLAIKETCAPFVRQAFLSAEQLLPFENATSKEQINSLLSLIYRLIAHSTLSTPELWKNYVALATKGATVEFVEELFDKLLIQQKAAAYFPNQRNRFVHCWIPLFKTLGKADKGSRMLLAVDEWSQYLLSEATGIPWTDFVHVTHSLAEGAVKALKAIEKQTDRSYLANLLITFLMTEKSFFTDARNALTDDGEYMLNVAEIGLMAKSENGISKACGCLGAIFMLMNPVPSCEERAVQLANEAVNQAVATTNRKSTRDIAEVLSKVLASAHCKESNYFVYLDFFLKHQDPIELRRVLEHIAHKRRDAIRVYNIYIDELVRILDLIFSIPSAQIPRSIPQHHINLVSQAIWQLQKFNKLGYAKFLIWCSKQPAFGHYVRKDTQELIKPIKELYRKNLLILHIEQKWLELIVLYNLSRFRISAFENGCNFRRQLFPVEKRVLNTLKDDCIKVIKRAFVIAFLATSYFYFLSTLVDADRRRNM